MRLRFDKKGRVKLTAGGAVFRADLKKLCAVLTGRQEREARARLRALSDKEKARP